MKKTKHARRSTERGGRVAPGFRPRESVSATDPEPWHRGTGFCHPSRVEIAYWDTVRPPSQTTAESGWNVSLPCRCAPPVATRIAALQTITRGYANRRVKPAFLPLPPGAVEPEGWLRDWAQAARNGITGHLDEWHPTFAEGWKGVPVPSTGAKPDGTGWPIEPSAYWLDGAIRLGFVLHDEALIGKMNTFTRIELLRAQASREDSFRL